MKKSSKKGFTIVELVIVIGVIGILSAILIPTFTNLTKNAQETAFQADLRSAFSAYAIEAVDESVDTKLYKGTQADHDDLVGEVKIAYLSMEEVALHAKDGKDYKWSAADDKWVVAASKGACVVTLPALEDSNFYWSTSTGTTGKFDTEVLASVHVATFYDTVVYRLA